MTEGVAQSRIASPYESSQGLLNAKCRVQNAELMPGHPHPNEISVGQGLAPAVGVCTPFVRPYGLPLTLAVPKIHNGLKRL